ncbi:MAG: Glycerophosphoryl diester phosphodiesterase [Alphaproteobacteria bacterium MarineAlpha5_Bin11]|nr:hypothetical protein [Pelagibacteraceae bacterium]PPR45155.1 MAG: Glycerophosphoryl diester phosphodiesterase [Alphaproteobacteria bacterium MarineAlpha5_Bin11]PPR52127.1 MAG: Glycerophosphoryl diester phosphodiesterase [Alphaproteobacteria bacterium MarineAlpha5_Bin10]
MQKIFLPKIIGHRGAKSLAPENTLSGIYAAVLHKTKFIEIDVKISKDKIPVLLHDDTIDRTSDGWGKCSDLNFSELSKFDYGSWFDESFVDEKILSLKECLEYINRKKIGLNIELKLNKGREKEGINSIKKLFKRKKITTDYFFSSFNIVSLDHISKIFPNIPRGILVDKSTKKQFSSLEDLINICNKYNCFSIGIDSKIIDKNMVDYLKKRKLLVNVFTINKLDDANELFSWGVNSIFTDRPDIFIINS